MRMCSCECQIAFAILGIIFPKVRETLENAVTDARIPCQYVKNHVDKSIIRATWISNNKCTRVNPLSKTGPDLIRVTITIEWYLYNRPGVESISEVT